MKIIRMKLRNVVVGMLVLGLAAPASAAYGNQMKSHKAAAMGSGSSNGCMSSTVSSTVMGNSYSSGASNDACWFNRVTLGGSVAMDIGHVSNNVGEAKLNNKVADVRNVALTADVALAKDWAGHLTVNVMQDNKYVNNDHVFPANDSKLDEAWVYYHDATAPVYFKIGKMFMDFGSYSNPYTAMPSLNQIATQFDANALQLGWTGAQGFDAAVFGFMVDTTTTEQKHGFGGNLSYSGEVQKGVTVHANLGIVNDYRGVYRTGVNAPVSGSTTDRFDIGQNAWQTITAERKAAWNGTLSLAFQGLDGYVSYVHVPQLVAGTPDTKLNIWSLGAGYTTTINVPMHFNVAWEKTNDNSSATMNTKNHISASFMADVVKNISAGISYNKYEQFNPGQGGGNDIKAILASVQVSF